MRFCFPTTFYPPYSFGGDGIAVQRLARALVRRGHSVTVVHDVDAFLALHTGPEPEARHEADGVEVIPLKSAAGILSPLLTQQTGRPTLHRARLREILDGGKFDVVNFHNASLMGGPGAFSFGVGAVKVFTAHDHWLVCPSHDLWRHSREVCTGRQCFRCQIRHHRPPQLWRDSDFLEKQLEQIDVCIAMSEFSRSKHREFGLQRDMVVLPQFLPILPGDTTTSETTRPHERPYFLFVGRLERIKGLHTVIPLFDRYPHADLVIAGDGSQRADLELLAGSSSSVRFLGRVGPEKLRELYAHAIATIVPSVGYETFGLVVIESLQRRTPVIARRLGPFPEIISACDGGELFENDSELLSAMTRIQSDVSHRNRLAENGYNGFVENWSEDAVIPRYLELVSRDRLPSGRARLKG